MNIVRGILESHALAYERMKASAQRSGQKIQIGMAHHMRIFDPKSAWNPVDQYLAAKLDEVFNWTISEAMETGRLKINIPFVVAIDEPIRRLKNTQDFFGINYYTRDTIRIDPSSKEAGSLELKPLLGSWVNDLGWEIYPEGMYRLLMTIKNKYPHKPIYITENGVADATDQTRTQFIVTHLQAVKRAMDEGASVKGYCHWTLTDNFEWGEGFTAKFGLYELNPETQERTLRESGKAFSKIIKNNGF